MAVCALRVVFLCFYCGVVRVADATERGVKPRTFTVLADPQGGDWNTARATCNSVNMTLASVDLHAFLFLVSQSFLRDFQRYAGRHFWIGLYDENGRGQFPSSVGNYRWIAGCETPPAHWEFWDDGQPTNNAEAYCVYADNATLRWRNDACSARHQYLCQREEGECAYKRTRSTCTLYVPTRRQYLLPHRTVEECRNQCDHSHMDTLPCWGFTMTSKGCVLHHQETQPNCDVVHQESDAYFRVCFHMFYVDGPFMSPSSTELRPLVPHCAPLVHTTEMTTSSPFPMTTTTACQDTTHSDDEESSTASPSSPPTPSPQTSPSTPVTSTPSSTPHTTTATTTTTTAAPVTTTSTVATSNIVNGVTTTTIVASTTTTGATTTTATVSTTIASDTTAAEAASSTVLSDLGVKAIPLLFRATTEMPSHISRYTQPTRFCKCDFNRRNSTAAVKKAEVQASIRGQLEVDVRTLSSTRRRKSSAPDQRPSSRGLAYVGVGLVLLALACVLLPDVFALMHHVRHVLHVLARSQRKQASHMP